MAPDRMTPGGRKRVQRIWSAWRRTLLHIGSASLWVVIGACGHDGTAPMEPGPDTPAEVARVEVYPSGESRDVSERPMGVLGVTIQLAAGARAEDGSPVYGLRSHPERFSWSSSDPEVATVEGGAITSVSDGTATISATVEGVTGSITVPVRDRARSAWSVPLPGGPGHRAQLGADGTIYVTTADYAANMSLLSALSPEGSVLWTLGLPLAAHSTPAIGSDGTLYIGSRSTGAGDFAGRLIAVDPGGTVRWVLEDIDGIRGSPAIGADGTIYVAGGRHVYAVDPDGEIQWTYERDENVFVVSSPAVGSDGTIYVGGYDRRLHAINPDGSQRWTFTTGDLIQGSPSIGPDGTIYFGSNDGRLYAVDPDGTERWSVELDWRGVPSSPSIGPDGTIYVIVDGVVAIDPAGSIRWKYRLGIGGSFATPILGADGTVYIGAAGRIRAFDAQGELLWDYPTDGGSPILGLDGTVLAAADDLHAMVETDPTNGGFEGAPWPTARGDRANTGRAGG